MSPLDAANLITKALLYAVSLGAIGAALHGALGMMASRRAYFRLAGLVAVAAILRLIILNAQMGGSLSAALSAEQFGWTWTAGGPPALALLVGAGFLIVAGLLHHRVLLMPAAISISASFALTGHSAGLEAPGFAPWIVAGHLLIAGFWFAAPATLWPRSGMKDADVLARTEAFSRVARVIVPFVFLSGIYLFWRFNDGFYGLLSSGYGQLLASKLLAATLLLGLGAVNLMFVTRQLAAQPARGRAALRATLRAEAILFAVIVIIIAAATTVSGPTT
jgi:copper resistance protein D